MVGRARIGATGMLTSEVAVGNLRHADLAVRSSSKPTTRSLEKWGAYSLVRAFHFPTAPHLPGGTVVRFVLSMRILQLWRLPTRHDSR